LAGATKRLIVGGSVLLVPLHDPERIAEAAAAFQSMFPGRLRLLVGAGYFTDEFGAAGIDISKRGQRIVAAYDRLLKGDLKERFGATELWSGQFSEVGRRRAGRYGRSTVLGAATGEQFRQLKEHYESQFHPFAGDKPRYVTMCPIWIETDPRKVEWISARAMENFRSAYSVNYVDDVRRIGHFDATAYEQVSDLESQRKQHDALIDNEGNPSMPFSSSSQMVDYLGPLVEAGVNAIIFSRFDGTTPEMDTRAMDLVASEVVPQLQRMAR
jgi:alkanesulfonate monooxygenase SsuD/methylene tetrahydromethanopterin reductase-like flavin-dependent oxidoreductase (luciferase family)